MIELQEVDCNCNDCKFLIRDLEKFNRSEVFHRKLCLEEFERDKAKTLSDANQWYNKGEWDKGHPLEIQGLNMKFQFQRKDECLISFGQCSKLNKSVSFIPGICQVETQKCFEHRKS